MTVEISISKSGVEIRNYSVYALHLPGYAVRMTTFRLSSTIRTRPRALTRPIF